MIVYNYSIGFDDVGHREEVFCMEKKGKVRDFADAVSAFLPLLPKTQGFSSDDHANHLWLFYLIHGGKPWELFTLNDKSTFFYLTNPDLPMEDFLQEDTITLYGAYYPDEKMRARELFARNNGMYQYLYHDNDGQEFDQYHVSAEEAMFWQADIWKKLTDDDKKACGLAMQNNPSAEGAYVKPAPSCFSAVRCFGVKNYQIVTVFLFILLALPIPVSVVSWIGTIMAVANIGMTNWAKPGESLQGIVALMTMVLAGTYLFTYSFSLIKTRASKKLSLVSFLPIAHLLLTVAFMFLWNYLNVLYRH